MPSPAFQFPSQLCYHQSIFSYPRKPDPSFSRIRVSFRSEQSVRSLIQPFYPTEIQNTFRQTSIRDDSRAVVAQRGSLTLSRHSVKELQVWTSMASSSVSPSFVSDAQFEYADSLSFVMCQSNSHRAGRVVCGVRTGIDSYESAANANMLDRISRCFRPALSIGDVGGLEVT